MVHGTQLDPSDKRRISTGSTGEGAPPHSTAGGRCAKSSSAAWHICADISCGPVSSRHPELRMNKTTVYRALDLLLDMGLVSEHKCGDGRAQYELAARGSHKPPVVPGLRGVAGSGRFPRRTLAGGAAASHGFTVELESYSFSACARRQELTGPDRALLLRCLCNSVAIALAGLYGPLLGEREDRCTCLMAT